MRTNRIKIETELDADRDQRNVPVRHLRNESPLIPNCMDAPDRRAYLQRLRAAEMAAWERTGGDYLSSDYVATSFLVKAAHEENVLVYSACIA